VNEDDETSNHKPIESKSEAKANEVANLKLLRKALRNTQGQEDDQTASTDGSWQSFASTA
jgi:hypothetical protein